MAETFTDTRWLDGHRWNRSQTGNCQLVDSLGKGEGGDLDLLQHRTVERNDIDNELRRRSDVLGGVLAGVHGEFEAGREMIVAQAGCDRCRVDAPCFVDRCYDREGRDRRRQPVEVLLGDVNFPAQEFLLAAGCPVVWFIQQLLSSTLKIRAAAAGSPAIGLTTQA